MKFRAESSFLQSVLESDPYNQHPSLKKIMYDFLNKDSWDKPKTAGHKKVYYVELIYACA